MASKQLTGFEPLTDASGFVDRNDREGYQAAEAEAVIGTLPYHVSADELEAAEAARQTAWNNMVTAQRHERSTDVLQTGPGPRTDGEPRAAFEWLNGVGGGLAALLSFLVPATVTAIIVMQLKFEFIALNPALGLVIGGLAVGGLFSVIDFRKRLKRQRAQNRFDQAIAILTPLTLLVFVCLGGAVANPESLSWMQPASAAAGGAGDYGVPAEAFVQAPDIFTPPTMIVLIAMTLFDIFAGAMIHRFAHDRLTPPVDDVTTPTAEFSYITGELQPQVRARLDTATQAKADLEHRLAINEAAIARHKAGAASHYDRLRARYEADIALAKANALDVMARDHVAGLFPLHSATSLNGGSHDTAH